MQTRTLGRTGVKVTPLCLGAMMFGAWGNTDHDESIRIIHRALDAGINFIDTADIYSAGESEEIVGKALAGGRRENFVLATKFLAATARDGLDRPLPGAPLGRGDRPRRDARRAHGSRPVREGPLHRLLDVPG